MVVVEMSKKCIGARVHMRLITCVNCINVLNPKKQGALFYFFCGEEWLEARCVNMMVS